MPHACRIHCLSLEGRRIARVGLLESDGRTSVLPAAEVIRAIEAGEKTCYVTLGGHSHLVTVTLDNGEKALATFVGELAALPLPECP